MQPGFSLPSFAKLNWTLRVVGKRADGFHELFTVFQTVSLHDTIHFEAAGELEFSCDDPSIPTDDRNLIIKAAQELQASSNSIWGARVHLEKRIPSPGGLGGGSSNAAVALMGFRRLWNLDVPDETVNKIAAALGSDVPFFLQGGTAIGTGRGELIEPIGDIDESEMLVITPDVNVSTRVAFERMAVPTLTNEESNRILRVCRLEADSLDLLHSELINDFEASVFSAYPEIKRVKDTLLDLRAARAALCGSGASVFAIFDKKEARQTAQEALGHEPTWRKFAVSTISQGKYREALGI